MKRLASLAILVLTLLTITLSPAFAAGDKDKKFKTETNKSEKFKLEKNQSEKFKTEKNSESYKGQKYKTDQDDQALSDLKFTGTVVKEYLQKKDKEGKTQTIDAFFLKKKDGSKVQLPQQKLKNKDGSNTGAIDLNEFVSMQVEITAKGRVSEDKKGIQTTKVQQLVSIKKY